MRKTLLDYARAEFPNHTVEVWTPDGRTPALHLTASTAVAHVFGVDDGHRLMSALRTRGRDDVAAVLVAPAPTTVLPNRREDPDGVSDLPRRRLVAAGIVGAVVGFAAFALVWFAIDRHAGAALILGLFGALVGAGMATLIGGLGRFAGERAWSQPNAPDECVAVVAVLADDDARSRHAVELMQGADPQTVRLVDAEGTWRVPNTWTTDHAG